MMRSFEKDFFFYGNLHLLSYAYIFSPLLYLACFGQGINAVGWLSIKQFGGMNETNNKIDD